jgi:hypothetical protein
MSKCPDAEYAEATIITVMENVGHKAELNFTYIATYVTLVELRLMKLDGKTRLKD